jgi:hypothetical protein
MSESFLERLSRFTPDAGRLDRDALLFAAGRASARPNRGWITLASALWATQVLMLALLWPHSTSPVAGSGPTIAKSATPPADLAPRRLEGWASPGVWSASPSLLESELEDRPDETVTLIESGLPLRAFSPPSAVLN